VQTESTLWHGTSLDTLESINVTGFNRSYCGKNGTNFSELRTVIFPIFLSCTEISKLYNDLS